MDSLVSIIVPVYNGEKYLKQCIESLIAQTYKDIEIILVNDGSTDKSLDICTEYAAKDNRVRVIDKENEGASKSRNLGIDESNGDYLAFIDCDDYIAETMIEDMLKAAISNEVDVVRAKVIRVDYSGRETAEDFYDASDKVFGAKEKVRLLSYFYSSKKSIACYSCLLLIKRDSIVRYDETLSYMEDSEFYARLILNCDGFFFLDKKVYYYRFNEMGITRAVPRTFVNIDSMLNSLRIIKNEIISGLADQYKQVDIDKLIEEINKIAINMVISKIKIAISSKCFKKSDIKKKIKSLLKTSLIKEYTDEIDFKSLSKQKKLEIRLMKKEMASMLYAFLKLAQMLKRE